MQQTVGHAIAVEHFAKVTWALAAAGQHAADISGYDRQRYDTRDPNRPRPPSNRGGQAVPPEERGVMVAYVNRLKETVGLPNWQLDDEG